jgi:hypothetical protein
MYKLPKDVQLIIYQYDNTYKIMYDKVLNSLNQIFRLYDMCKYSNFFDNDLRHNINSEEPTVFHIIKYSK